MEEDWDSDPVPPTIHSDQQQGRGGIGKHSDGGENKDTSNWRHSSNSGDHDKNHTRSFGDRGRSYDRQDREYRPRGGGGRGYRPRGGARGGYHDRGEGFSDRREGFGDHRERFSDRREGFSDRRGGSGDRRGGSRGGFGDRRGGGFNDLGRSWGSGQGRYSSPEPQSQSNTAGVSKQRIDWGSVHANRAKNEAEKWRG